MRSPSPSLADRMPAQNRRDEGHGALLLAAAIGIGLLFAGTLTVFGEPLTHSLKDLALKELALKDLASAAAPADPSR